MYAYIDESGDTGYTKKSSRYFILTAVIVDDPFVLRRIAKNIHRYNLDKKKLNMLHANQESVSVKNKLIAKLSVEEINCISIVLDKKMVRYDDLYVFALRKIAQHLADKRACNVVIAKKDTRKSYNQKITSIFNADRINFSFSTPPSEKSLQIADFYCWAIFSYYEHGMSQYFEKLKHQINHIVL